MSEAAGRFAIMTQPLSPLTMMAVHAHPDDEASSTGGVLARYSDEGVRTIVVTCTNGEFGDGPAGLKPGEDGHDTADVAQTRLAELRVLGNPSIPRRERQLRKQTADVFTLIIPNNIFRNVFAQAQIVIRGPKPRERITHHFRDLDAKNLQRSQNFQPKQKSRNEATSQL